MVVQLMCMRSSSNANPKPLLLMKKYSQEIISKRKRLKKRKKNLNQPQNISFTKLKDNNLWILKLLIKQIKFIYLMNLLYMIQQTNKKEKNKE